MEYGRDDKEIEIAKVAEFFFLIKFINLSTNHKIRHSSYRKYCSKISDVIKDFSPDEILVPHLGDIHTDHHVVHKAVVSCTKWFRYPFIKEFFLTKLSQRLILGWILAVELFQIFLLIFQVFWMIRLRLWAFIVLN